MSKTYRVVFSSHAKQEIRSAFLWIKQRSRQRAEKWERGFREAIYSLDRQPARCQLAPENSSFTVEIRQLLYGKRPHRYRALFTIEDNCVNILFIRHYAQDWIIPEDQ